MEKIYTPMEEVLIKGALYMQAKETKAKTNELLKLDLLLLEAEEKAGLMDGLPLEAWLL